MGKYYLSNFSFQWGCNILSSIHLTLTLFTRGRIMSHFLLPFLWLCMNLLCLIILLINMPGIWHLAFQIPISIMSWQQLQIKNPNLAGLICKVHFLFHQIDWWLDHLSDSGKNERKEMTRCIVAWKINVIDIGYFTSFVGLNIRSNIGHFFFHFEKELSSLDEKTTLSVLSYRLKILKVGNAISFFQGRKLFLKNVLEKEEN